MRIRFWDGKKTESMGLGTKRKRQRRWRLAEPRDPPRKSHNHTTHTSSGARAESLLRAKAVSNVSRASAFSRFPAVAWDFQQRVRIIIIIIFFFTRCLAGILDAGPTRRGKKRKGEKQYETRRVRPQDQLSASYDK